MEKISKEKLFKKLLNCKEEINEIFDKSNRIYDIYPWDSYGTFYNTVDDEDEDIRGCLLLSEDEDLYINIIDDCLNMQINEVGNDSPYKYIELANTIDCDDINITQELQKIGINVADAKIVNNKLTMTNKIDGLSHEFDNDNDLEHLAYPIENWGNGYFDEKDIEDYTVIEENIKEKYIIIGKDSKNGYGLLIKGFKDKFDFDNIDNTDIYSLTIPLDDFNNYYEGINGVIEALYWFIPNIVYYANITFNVDEKKGLVYINGLV